MDILSRVYAKAKAGSARIALAEADDPRVAEAAQKIEQQGLARLTLIGDPAKVAGHLKGARLKAEILDATSLSKGHLHRLAQAVCARRKELDEKEALRLLATDAHWLAAALVLAGEADGYVGGNLSPTADTLRPALKLLRSGDGLASSYFLILHEGRAMLFADCALNIEPGMEQLARIGADTAASAAMLGLSPKVAFLSFSTKGSAHHALARKIADAAELARKLVPAGIEVDGELQFDAAYDVGVGASKAPGSSVAGHANVLIFPDLSSANIGYKLAQRMAGARAIGPIVQGLGAAVNDLSRGCSAQDIVDVVAFTAMRAGQRGE